MYLAIGFLWAAFFAVAMVLSNKEDDGSYSYDMEGYQFALIALAAFIINLIFWPITLFVLILYLVKHSGDEPDNKLVPLTPEELSKLAENAELEENTEAEVV